MLSGPTIPGSASCISTLGTLRLHAQQRGVGARVHVRVSCRRCIRVLSDGDRYGHSDLALEFFVKATQTSDPSGVYVYRSAYRSTAPLSLVMSAVMSWCSCEERLCKPWHAVRNQWAVRRCHGGASGLVVVLLLTKLLADTLATAHWLSLASCVMQSAMDVPLDPSDRGGASDIARVESLKESFQSKEAKIRSWLGQFPSGVTGGFAQLRMDVLGCACKTILMWH
jgi:hypothetical protein